MARKLEVSAAVACLIAPTHPAQVAAVLDRLRPEQALIVALPGESDVAVFRACRDFSDAESAGRLFFAGGANWAGEVEAVYDKHPGLPVPGEFIRLAATDAARFDALRPAAEGAFNRLTRRSIDALEAARRGWCPTGGGRFLLIATDRFALWDDDGNLLRRLFAGADVATLDPFDPRTSAPLAVASAAAGCDAAVSAGLFRAGLRAALPDGMPLMAWTGGRVPAFEKEFPADRLIVAGDRLRATALKLGWPGDRVTVAARPVESRPPAKGPPTLAIIADLPDSLDPPAAVREYSSHRLLWEFIAKELASDPAAVGAGVAGYLQTRLTRFGLKAAEVNIGLFRDSLILPACRMAVARRLRGGGVALRVYGAGWADFGECWGGPVASRGDFEAAAGASAGLVQVDEAESVAFAGRPTIHALGRPVERVAREAHDLLARPVAKTSAGVELEARLIREVLASAVAWASRP